MAAPHILTKESLIPIGLAATIASGLAIGGYTYGSTQAKVMHELKIEVAALHGEIKTLANNIDSNAVGINRLQDWMLRLQQANEVITVPPLDR